MLVIFRSKAAANVMMFGDLTEHLLGILGRELTSEGIFTVEQLPHAIQKLETAITEDRAKHNILTSAYQEDEEKHTEYLCLAQRAFPLLDMLRHACKANEVVFWQISSTSLDK